MKRSLHAQASSVDVALQAAKQRGQIRMRPSEWEMHEGSLKAACDTFRALQAWRSRLPREFLEELER